MRPPSSQQRRRLFHRERTAMPVQALQCKECHETYPLDARYVCERCFGPLEVAYDLTRPRRRLGQAAHPGRPADDLALLGLPAVRGAARAGPAGRPDAAPARAAARRGARDRRALHQERHRQPDALVQGPRRGGRGRQGAGARLRGRRLPVDGQPRQRRRGTLGGGGPRLVRLHPGRPRGAEGARHRGLRHPPGRRARHLRRRQPALHRAVGASATGPSSTSTCGPTTRRARRRSRSRSPSSSASSCRTAWSRRSRPARCSRRSRAASRSGARSG